jgi:hypothetical protein
MTRAMVTITLIFVAGTAAFAASLVSVIASREFDVLDITLMVAAGLAVAASTLGAVRRRPAIASASMVGLYTTGYGYKRVEH